MNWQRLLKWTSISLAGLAAGCATTISSGKATATPISQNIPSINLESSSSYLSQASSSTGSAQYEYQLLAIARYLQDNNIDAANQLLTQLNHTPLQGIQAVEFKIAQAGVATASDDPFFGSKVLSKVSNTNGLNTTWQLIYWQTAYSTYSRSANKPSSLYALIKYLQLSNSQSPENIAPLWKQLQTLPISSLSNFANSPDLMIQGWGQLALAARQNANQPQNLINAIQTWQVRYRNHPANQLIPDISILNAASNNSAPTQIALLLPITGPYASMGQAVRDGFMTAYFNNTSTTARPNIKVYDTNNASISSLYQQAVTNGAQEIVGPLLKDDVNQLANTGNLAVPTIALNYTDGSISSPQMIEMGLSPEMAAQQAANLAWQHGVSKVIIISANNSWASNVSDNFVSQWKALGGQIMGSIAVDNDPKTLPSQIMQILQVDQSQLSLADKLKLIKHHSTAKTIKRMRRTDINGIFLLAPPELARQVEPLLKFYFAGDLPVFSTSYIYNGLPDTNRNRDLDGTFFNDIPWVLNDDPQIANARQQVSTAWASNYRTNTRLFAVGYDAYNISLQFNRLTNLPSFSMDGMTGRLYLSNQKVYGHLTNAVMRSGVAQALPW